MLALGVMFGGCSFFDDTETADEPAQEEPQEKTPVRYWSVSYRTVVRYKTTGRGCWHRVYFRKEGREYDSFENNVDCWNDLRAGDSIYVEEHFGGYHYYKIHKITN